ncbi:MAG: transglutaminaseTgpA domain-containing protein, partial [Pseudohongiellaceae bacterium]
MKEIFQIPRETFIWLLAALVAVILPHVGRMPIWLSLFCACCIMARIFIYQGRLSFPGAKIKVACVLFILISMALQFGRDIFAMESIVAIMVVGITLKLLEMQQKRDILLVIYLCYFTI